MFAGSVDGSNTDSTQLLIPRTKYKTFQARSFSVSGPTLWNQLPQTIRSVENCDLFKNKLKTYYLSL